MIIYFCATFISIIFAFIATRYNIKLQIWVSGDASTCINRTREETTILSRFFAVLSFFPLFIVSAIRYGVGTDYFFTYAPMFQAIAKGNTSLNVEFGYYLLNKITLIFTQDYAGIFVITSFLFCYFIYKAIFEQSINVPYSILLLLITSCYFFSMNGVRQGITIAMFLYALKYIKSQEFLKYVVIILLASSIHLSALIFIPAYFLCKIPIKPSIAYMILGAEIIFLPLIKTIVFKLVGYTKYSHYLDTRYMESKFDYSNFIVSIAILVFLYLLYNKAKDNPNYIIFSNCQFLSCFFLVLTYQISIMARFSVPYKYLGVLYLPLMTSSKYIKDRALRYVVNILIIGLYFAYMVISTQIKGFGDVLPYQTIFSR